MSDAYTEVTPSTGGGLGLWGYIEPIDAIAECRKYYEHLASQAAAALAALDRGEVTVFHQRGPYAAKGRKQVHPKQAEGSGSAGEQGG